MQPGRAGHLSFVEGPREQRSSVFERRWDQEPPSLHDVRAELDALLAESTIRPDRHEDIVLAVDELVTNALEHGASGPIRVRYVLAPESISITVSNAVIGTPVAAPERWRYPESSSPRGRGLPIVASLGDAVDVRYREDYVAITARFGEDVRR